MKTVNAYTTPENTTTFWIDVEGDIFDNKEDAELIGIAGKVVVDCFYVGTLEQMKQAALEKYLAG